MKTMLKWFGFSLLLVMLITGCASKEEKLQSHIDKGKNYFDKGEFAAAEIEFKNAIQINPESVEANRQLAETYLKAGKVPEAFQQYSMVIKLDPNNKDALLKLATFNMLARKFEESEKYVQAVLAQEPNNIDALFLRAGLYEMRGEPDKAVETYQRIVALDGKQARAYIGLAAILTRQSKFQEAESYLQKANALDPGDSKTWMALIGFYISRKEYDRAEKQIEQAIAAIPASVELRIMQGNFLAQQKKNDLAEAAFLKAIELDAKNVGAYLSTARFYDVTGKQDQAKAMYRQAMGLKQDDYEVKTAAARYFFKIDEIGEAETLIEDVLKNRAGYLPALLLKGEVLIQKRSWNDAIAVFDQAIGQDDKAGQAYYFKALAHMGKGEAQVAKSALLKAVELNPRDTRAKLLLAEIKLKERDFAGAERGGMELLSVLPDNYQVVLLLGRAYVGLGKLVEAQTSFNRLIALQPENPQGYFQLGIVQRMQKDDGAALANFEKALDLNPKLIDVFSQVVGILASKKDFTGALARCDRQLASLKDSPFHQAFILNVKGRLYTAQKMDKEAEQAYQAAIAVEPNFTQPYYGLAQLYLRRKEMDKAVEQYSAMLQKNPDMVGPNMLLGTLYDTQKKFDLSEKHYREVLRIDAGFAPAANNLAFLLADKGEKLDEALNLAQGAKAKLPEDPSVMDTLGWVYYKRGLFDSAISEFGDSLEKLPSNASVHYHIGLAYAKKGDTASAKEHLKKALELDADFDGAAEARRVLTEI